MQKLLKKIKSLLGIKEYLVYYHANSNELFLVDLNSYDMEGVNPDTGNTVIIGNAAQYILTGNYELLGPLK